MLEFFFCLEVSYVRSRIIVYCILFIMYSDINKLLNQIYYHFYIKITKIKFIEITFKKTQVKSQVDSTRLLN